MEIIEIPEDHALVELSSREILVLWKALNQARDSADAKAFLNRFEMTTDGAWELARKLSESLHLARRNR
jgi:hypothetical protein